MNEVLQCIADRRSIRKYADTQITAEQWAILLKAAVEAPSAANRQPWHFTVVTRKQILKDINAEVQKQMVKQGQGNGSGDVFYDAPSAIFISCVADSRWGRHDCGIAAENIALAAQSIGLGTVMLGMPEMGFHDEKKAEFEKLLKFPQGYSYCLAIAVGVPAGSKEAHPVNEGLIDWVN
jgi:nitroreductase